MKIPRPGILYRKPDTETNMHRDNSTTGRHAAATSPEYIPTGRALAVMDAGSFDIIRVFHTGPALSAEGEEDYEGLARKASALSGGTLPRKPLFVFCDTYDGTIGRAVIRRVIRACVSFQAAFVRTGDPADCRPMGLRDISAFTRIDPSVVSRATRNVRVVAPAGVFTLDSADPSLDVPSLFDEGAARTDGTRCGRKAVLASLRRLAAEEDPANALTDDDYAAALSREGFDVARRTVAKYRALLGIPKWSDRRRGA